MRKILKKLVYKWECFFTCYRPKERIAMYELAIEYFQMKILQFSPYFSPYFSSSPYSAFHSGICAFFKSKNVDIVSSYENLNNFPELTYLRPSEKERKLLENTHLNHHGYWFSISLEGDQQRIALLKAAVEMASKLPTRLSDSEKLTNIWHALPGEKT